MDAGEGSYSHYRHLAPLTMKSWPKIAIKHVWSSPAACGGRLGIDMSLVKVFKNMGLRRLGVTGLGRSTSKIVTFSVGATSDRGRLSERANLFVQCRKMTPKGVHHAAVREVVWEHVGDACSKACRRQDIRASAACGSRACPKDME